MPRPFSTPGKDPVSIVQETGWAPGPVWTSAENLAPTRARSPDRPARSQSLYRLSYPAHRVMQEDDESLGTFCGGDLREQLRDYSLSKNICAPWRKLCDFLQTTINTDCNVHRKS
jgi:hypothetical protein